MAEVQELPEPELEAEAQKLLLRVPERLGEPLEEALLSPERELLTVPLLLRELLALPEAHWDSEAVKQLLAVEQAD